MPYITKEKRDALDASIDNLHRALIGLEMDDEGNNMEGNLNYSITRLLRLCYNNSYQSINDAIGMLQCVMLEHYRTQAVPYEDQKKFDNGDIDSELASVTTPEIIITTAATIAKN